jgi:hypothetical protein
MIAVRQPAEPTLMKIVEPGSLEAYYSRSFPIHNAATIDLSSRTYDPQDVVRLVGGLPPEQAVWVIMPNNIGETWAMLAALDRTRHIGFRRAVDYMLVYRFDPGDHEDLAFTFGDLLRYQGAFAATSLTLAAGEQFCPPLSLTAQKAIDESYSYGLHLVDTSGHLVAQVDHGLGAWRAGATIQLTPCLDLPTTLTPGNYLVHLVIYTWANGQRLPVLEQAISWGNALVVAVIRINDEIP